MNQNDVQKYLQLQEQLMTDDGYGCLLQEYREKNAEFLAVLEGLAPQQRQTIEDYLGVCAELHTKLLLLACER